MSTMRRRSRREWAQVVGAWKRSGLSATEFGKRRRVLPATLKWWRWRLGKAGLPGPVSAAPAPEFIEVAVVPSSERGRERRPVVAIELPGEIVIRVENGCDEETLRRVVTVLAGGRPC